MRLIRDNSRKRERGMSIAFVAASMVMILAMAALAIDLVTLYVGRSEAQRAADSAALAGAMEFVRSGYLNGGATATQACDQARAAAKAVGAQNKVGSIAADIRDEDVPLGTGGCDTSRTGNPLVTVHVRRTVARGNGMPTLFAKIFGHDFADVSAVATAEAYNPDNSGPTVCRQCMKPLFVPNCDPNHVGPTPLNGVCGGVGGVPTPTAYFIQDNGDTANPGPWPTGIVGEQWILHTSSGPSQYYQGVIGTGGHDVRENLASCDTTKAYKCGDPIDIQTGGSVGNVSKGIQDLIHAKNDGFNKGQDTIDTSTQPFKYLAGGENPLVRQGLISAGTQIPTSDSIVNVPVYDGHNMCPGASCEKSAPIVGFMEMFLQETHKAGGGDQQITAVILGVSGCGGSSGTCNNGTGGGTGSVGGGVGGGVPIRLVKTP